MTDTEVYEALPIVLPPNWRSMDKRRKRMVSAALEWKETSAQTVGEATEIMDQLENSGVREITVEVNGVEGLIVRWR